MSSPLPVTRITNTHDHLTALVRLGIAEFGRRTVPDGSAFYDALELEAQQLLADEQLPQWQTELQELERIWPLSQGPLGQLIKDYRLSLEQAFFISLIGEVESSHLINLSLNRLQAPAASIRPSMHLCQAVLTQLFTGSNFSIQAFPGSQLIQDHLIIMEGEGPLPLRSLRMDPHLWAILSEQGNSWPGAVELKGQAQDLLPVSVLQELPKLADLLLKGETRGLVLRAVPGSGRSDFAQALASSMGMQAIELSVSEWEQSQVLPLACRYARLLPVVRTQLGPGEVWRLPRGRANTEHMLVLMGSDGAIEEHNMLELSLPHPDEQERHAIWKQQLNSQQLADKLADTAIFSGSTIRTLASHARLIAERAGETPGLTHVAEARWQMGAERLRLLAQPVRRVITADSLVLPEIIMSELDAMIARSRRRESLWQGLGSTLNATRNLGLRALFVGESGTGKTLVSSYIATSLGAPLYRVDLASVMNKYIGESEKNLGQLLDHAAANDVVLLFDEADSLFGRRSEGKETGERYANMLTNFLLTRIENHPGIVLLTSNSRERIDAAFTRRLDFITEFPIPGYEERYRLWNTHMGERGPGDKIYKYLASYSDLTGGQIRNVVLAAAARAGAGAGDKIINTQDIFHGLESEYRKQGRSMPAKLMQMQNEL